MPNTDPEKRREYDRDYYERTKNTPQGERRKEKQSEYRKEYWPGYYEKNREKIIEAVKARKKEEYAGKCVVCGAKTTGVSKTRAPRFCRDHRHEQWVEKQIILAGGESPWGNEADPKLIERIMAHQKSTRETFSKLKRSGPVKWKKR